MRLYLDVAASAFHTNRSTGEEPRVVRLAWWNDEEPGPVVRLIRPSSNLTIDPVTTPYHGVTLEHLERDGVPPDGVIAELGAAAAKARTIVSYNQEFHWRNLHRLMGYVGAPRPTQAVDAMSMAADVLRIPPSRGREWKSPSLKEACEFFQLDPPLREGSPIAIALSTVRAVRGVYEAIIERDNEVA